MLVAGLPATGKSTLCERMQAKLGFAHYDMEHPERWPRPELHQTWQVDIPAFVHEVGRYHRGKVVLDWGFPTHCIGMVEQLEQSGVHVVWLTGDPNELRKSFVLRGGIPIECFETQIRDIEAANLPGKRGWTVIRTVDSKGHRKSAEVVLMALKFRLDSA